MIQNILKMQKSIGEEIEFELKDIITTIKDFFIMIKENTYDVLVSNFGADIVNILLLGIGIVLVIFILLKLINHD